MAKAAGNSYSPYLHLPRQPPTLPPNKNTLPHGESVLVKPSLMVNGPRYEKHFDLAQILRASMRSFLALPP